MSVKFYDKVLENKLLILLFVNGTIRSMLCLCSGNIRELFDTSLKSGHAAAFSEDCDSTSSKSLIRGAGNQVLLFSIFLHFSLL